MSTTMILSTESIERFREYLYERGMSENTIRAYSSDLRELERWSPSPVPVEKLASTTARWIMETKADVAPRTTNRRLGSVRAFAKFAGLGLILEDFKAPTVTKSKPHPIPEGTKGVLAMCEAAPSLSHRALFALQGLMGLRVSEALDIEPKHFDLDHMTLTVRGKGDKTRVVPISQTAWRYLDAAHAAARVAGGRLVPLSDRGARMAVTRTGETLGFSRPISSHDLRATCATALFNKTGNIRAAQELLGHASITTTEVYTGVSEDLIREGLEFDE